MQNRLVRSRGTTRYFVTCALGIGATENPKLSLLYVLILWFHHASPLLSNIAGTLCSSEQAYGTELHKFDAKFFAWLHGIHAQESRPQMFSMHDGAPAHFSLSVRGHFDAHYPGCWIGRDGLIAWPPRSPGLNPLNFYLWGHLKSSV